ncbi:hypothetical protein TCON_2631 [Astathelohania contejeani]|uniref:Uncharacterized protein n=1 Tax=Astathelohania contejeani TaxID=164912 RepID=A0ABQ7HVH3_9MICR|nr:hypothetical protein TCON_2631 [Thelohania contejeani]
MMLYIQNFEEQFYDLFTYNIICLLTSNDIKFLNEFYKPLYNLAYILINSDINPFHHIIMRYMGDYAYYDAVLFDVLVEDINIVDEKSRKKFKVLDDITFNKESYELMNIFKEKLNNLVIKFGSRLNFFTHRGVLRDIALLRYVLHPIGTDVSIFNEILLVWCYLYQLFAKGELFNRNEIGYNERFTKYIIMLENRIHYNKNDEKKRLLYAELIKMQDHNIKYDFQYEHLDKIKNKDLLLCYKKDKPANCEKYILQ